MGERKEQHKLGNRDRRNRTHTSEFLELVSIPTAPFLSIKTVDTPSLACNFLATARPTTPPPITACVKSALLSADEVKALDTCLKSDALVFLEGVQRESIVVILID